MNPFKLIGKTLKSSAPHLAKAALGFVPDGSMATMLGRTAIKEIAAAIGVKLLPADDDAATAAKIEAGLAGADADKLAALKERNIKFMERKRELESMDRAAVCAGRKDSRGVLARLSGGMRYVAMWTGILVVTAWVGTTIAVVYASIFLGTSMQDAALVISLIANLGGAAMVIVNLFFGGQPSEGKDQQDKGPKQ